MKRNLAGTTVVFNNKECGENYKPDDLKFIPEDFDGNVIIMGNLIGEGDIHLKGDLWVYGEIQIEGDIEAGFVFAEGIICETLKAEDIIASGAQTTTKDTVKTEKGIACCEIIAAGDLLSIGIVALNDSSTKSEILGGTIECEADIEVLGNVLCKDLSGVDITIKGDLCVYESIVAGDVSVKGNLYCKEKIMVEDLVVSNCIYCGKDVNSEKDIFVKKDILCKDIEAVDIAVDGDLFCENVSARDVKVGGTIKCHRIEATSLNLD